MYLLIIIIIVFSAHSFDLSTLQLPHSETSEYKGAISCNSEIAIQKLESKNRNITKYEFDIWKLSIDDSECINIRTNNTNITLYDCHGIVIDSTSSNDYLSSTICKFTYFIQVPVKHFDELDKYKLKIFCSNGDNKQCDKTMRRLKSDENRVEIGYLRQLISIESYESDSSDSSDSSDETQNPTQSPTKFPSRYPSAFPSRYPSTFPSRYPTKDTKFPSRYPSTFPSRYPSTFPSRYPTNPSAFPSRYPSAFPSRYPTKDTKFPTVSPVCPGDCWDGANSGGNDCYTFEDCSPHENDTP